MKYHFKSTTFKSIVQHSLLNKLDVWKHIFSTQFEFYNRTIKDVLNIFSTVCLFFSLPTLRAAATKSEMFEMFYFWLDVNISGFVSQHLLRHTPASVSHCSCLFSGFANGSYTVAVILSRLLI